jgi:integrase
VLSWGIDQGLLTRNATDGIANPRQAKHERAEVYPFQDWGEVERLSQELHYSYSAIPLIFVGLGVRPEEGFALHRSDIEWNHDHHSGRIHIQRRFTAGLLKPGTKTGPDRWVPFGQRVYEALRSLPVRLETPILFPAPRGGYMDAENFRYRHWVPAIRAAEIQHHRLYDCRTTFISWHLAAGTPMSTVALWAGTGSQMIESTYRRYIPSEDLLAGAIDDFGAVAL